MSEDPTQEMRQPTLQEVLEAVNALGIELHSFRTTMEKRLDEMSTEMKAGFRNVERKVDVLNREMLQLKADYEGLDQRVSRLEPELKSS